MNSFYKGAILLVLSALGFGVLFIFALHAYKGGVSVTTLLVIRFTLAAVLLFIYVFIKFKRVRISKRDLFFLFILGGICYNLQARFYFSSIQYISPSLTALFLYTYPMIVTVLCYFVDKERITTRIGISIGISFTGLVMILGTSIGKINSIGIFLALGASLVYSIYNVLGSRMLKSTSPLVTSAFIALFSSVGVIISGMITNDISFGFEVSSWFPILAIVLFSTVLAMIAFFHGLELVGPTKASIISMTEPVFTVIFSAIFIGDRLTFIQLIGGLLVISGAVLTVWSKGHDKMVVQS